MLTSINVKTKCEHCAQSQSLFAPIYWNSRLEHERWLQQTSLSPSLLKLTLTEVYDKAKQYAE